MLYPRRDLCECPPDTPADIDAVRAQELIDRFVRAGAQYIFVSPVLYARGALQERKNLLLEAVSSYEKAKRLDPESASILRASASSGPEARR